MGTLEEQLVRGGIDRRQFLKFCGAMVATLALPARYVSRVAEALTSAVRPPLVWLEFQDCAGDTESFLRATQPSIDELLLEILSVNYHETTMVPAGLRAEKSLKPSDVESVSSLASSFLLTLLEFIIERILILVN